MVPAPAGSLPGRSQLRVAVREVRGVQELQANPPPQAGAGLGRGNHSRRGRRREPGNLRPGHPGNDHL
eukprot:1470662-Lingulodinium_polyedra.AAC.1